MIFLVDSYELRTNGVKQVIRILCVAENEVTNILWYDATEKVIPKHRNVLESTYSVVTRKHDNVVHVQNHVVSPKTFDKIRQKNLPNNV